MACTNPMLMAILDLKNARMDFYYRLRELGWKISIPDKKAYRLVSKESRSHFLENIPAYVNQEVIEVPCGNCIACRLQYSKDWANRCTLEASKYTHNYFITLSYDEEHVHKGKFGNNTINKADVQQFIRSLRNKLKREYGFTGVRYFGCQEYGDQFLRPHAHIILFNCPIPDLTKDFVQDDGSIIHIKCHSTGEWYHYSQFVKDVWPHGTILIAPCNWNTSAYVSRYVLKKRKGADSDVYEKLGIIPPYVFMSTKPGIGADYFHENEEKLMEIPKIVCARQFKAPLVSGLPRYYKKLIKRDHPAVYSSMVDEAKIKIQKSRSLLKGHQLINDNRAAQEAKIVAASGAFSRDL